MTQKLHPNDRRVLAAIQQDSRLPLSKVASLVGIRQHSVRSSLQKLKSRELITPYVLCNPHTLGLTDYCVFFNCLGDERSARKKIIQYCCASQKVAYFAEMTGLYQYSVSLFCKTIFEVTSFFETLNELIPRCSFDLHFAIRLQFTQFIGRRSDQLAKPVLLDRKQPKEEFSIDSTDRLLLAYLSQHADHPLRDAARLIGLAETSIRYRLASLEKKEIILGYPYLVNNNSLGIVSFRILISAMGMTSTLHQKIFDFMRKHPSGSAFVRCAGQWDFELNFEVTDTSAVGPIIGEVTDTFASHIRRIHTVHEIAIHRAHHFPLLAGIQGEEEGELIEKWRESVS